MDYESLGEEIVTDSVEDSEIYVKFSEHDDVRTTDRHDFEKAKGFLSTVSSKLNISLYDHLADVLQTILRSKIQNAVEKFEDLSLRVKKMRQVPDSGLTEAFQIKEELQDFLKEKQIFYKFPLSAPDLSQTIKTTEDEEDEDSDEEEENEAQAAESEEAAAEPAPDLFEALPDIYYVMDRFRQAGIGLGLETIYELSLALKDLVLQHKLRKVRFWGKIVGVEKDYYVAEAPYQEGIVQEHFGWEVEKEEEADQPVDEDEDMKEKDEEDEDLEEEEDEKEEPEEGEEAEEPEAVKIPPVPEMKPKIRKRIPPEANGTGINEYVYFVCSKIGHPWRVLPFLTPLQVTEARQIKRFFTGDLESQIRGCMPYPGKEAHYLRSQIARISASTYIAPTDYYVKPEEDEEEEDEEENGGNGFVINSEFVPRPATHLYSDGLNGWIHYRRAVLHQGRCVPMKLEKDDEEEEEKEDDEDEDEEENEEEPEILEAIVETEVPLLRSISEDRAVGRLKPWSIKLSSKLLKETAVLIVYSSLWPGAYTFYDGKNFDHIYIGYGYKYSVFNYAPPIRVSWHPEYEVGDDVIEHVDEEILPPEPEEEDEEDENTGEEPDENIDKEDEDEEESEEDED